MSVWLNVCTVLQVGLRGAEENHSDLASPGELPLDIGMMKMPCSRSRLDFVSLVLLLTLRYHSMADNGLLQ